MVKLAISVISVSLDEPYWNNESVKLLCKILINELAIVNDLLTTYLTIATLTLKQLYLALDCTKLFNVSTNIVTLTDKLKTSNDR